MRHSLFVAVISIVLSLAAGGTFAQGGKGKGERGPGMRPQGGQQAGPRPQHAGEHRGERMSPEERGKLRRDIEDANRTMPRKR